LLFILNGAREYSISVGIFLPRRGGGKPAQKLRHPGPSAGTVHIDRVRRSFSEGVSFLRLYFGEGFPNKKHWITDCLLFNMLHQHVIGRSLLNAVKVGNEAISLLVHRFLGFLRIGRKDQFPGCIKATLVRAASKIPES